MKIVDQTAQPAGKSIQNYTSNIPEGQVFRGTIYGRFGRVVTGVFLKTANRVNFQFGGHAQVIVVQLDGFDPGTPRVKNVRIADQPVTNYEPLEVELVIKKVL